MKNIDDIEKENQEALDFRYEEDQFEQYRNMSLVEVLNLWLNMPISKVKKYAEYNQILKKYQQPHIKVIK